MCIITLSAITPSMHHCYTWTVGRRLVQSVFKTQSSTTSFLHIKNLKIFNKNCLWLSKIQAEFWSLSSPALVFDWLPKLSHTAELQLTQHVNKIAAAYATMTPAWLHCPYSQKRHMWLWFGSCAKQGIQTDQSMMLLQKQLHFSQFCWRADDDGDDYDDKFVLGWQLQTNA